MEQQHTMDIKDYLAKLEEYKECRKNYNKAVEQHLLESLNIKNLKTVNFKMPEKLTFKPSNLDVSEVNREIDELESVMENLESKINTTQEAVNGLCLTMKAYKDMKTCPIAKLFDAL